jgi:hypothetical protein
MLDVLVIAVMVVAFKSFPGGSRVAMNWGAYVFGLSVVLSMIATKMIKDAHCSPEIPLPIQIPSPAQSALGKEIAPQDSE